jgi:O-antigen/teichoic acid export membrane protein
MHTSRRISPQGGLYQHAISSSALYSVAVFGPLVASFVMLPVYTRYLSPADYGVIELLDVARNIFSLLVAGRFAESLFYFYGKASSEEDRRDCIATLFWGAVAVGAVSVAAGLLLSPGLAVLVFRDSAFTGGFRLIFAAFGLSFPIEALLAIFRAEHRHRAYLATSIGRVAVSMAMTYSFVVVLRARVDGLLWSGVASNAMLAVPLFAFYLASRQGAFSPALFRQMLAFSFPLGVSGVALLIIHSGDRFFLERFANLNDVGIYALAYKLGMLVSYVQASFGTYWTANMYTALRTPEARSIFGRMNTYQMLAATYAGLCVIAFSSPFLHLAARPQFTLCLPYVALITAAYVIRAQGDYLRLSLWLDKRVTADAVLNWTVALFCTAAYAALIPRWKLWGAATATLLTFCLALAIAFRIAQRARGFGLEYKRLFILTGWAILLSGIAVSAQNAPPAITLPLAVAAAGSYPILLSCSGFWTPAERVAFSGLFRRVLDACLGAHRSILPSSCGRQQRIGPHRAISPGSDGTC